MAAEAGKGLKKDEKNGQGQHSFCAKTVQQERTFQPGDEMTEKTSLPSGKKRVNRNYYFLTYFSVGESQSVCRSDGGRLKTNERT